MAAPIGNMVVGTCCHTAKQARTELVDSPRALSAHPNWRDWGNLTDGPAGKIAERVFVDDVADYLRFRAVCSPWRRCTESPHAHNSMDRRFHPRRWIMLPRRTIGDIWKHKRRDFINVSTGERIQVDLPDLRRQFMFGPTSEGLILICDKRTYAVRLLNPLTRQLMALPNPTALLCSLNSEDKIWSSRLKRLQMYGHSPPPSYRHLVGRGPRQGPATPPPGREDAAAGGAGCGMGGEGGGMDAGRLLGTGGCSGTASLPRLCG